MVRPNCYYFFRNFIPALLFTVFACGALAQSHNISITGKVLDEKTREPLSGATVHLKNTTHEVITDNSGEFRFLTGQEFPVTVLVTYTGYQTQELVVPSATPVNILLHANNAQLNELTVVGYTRTKSNARTGAITTVTSDDFSKVAYTSVIEKLQGQVPGLSISNNSGVPGTSILVRLRGATSITAGNDPLYVVDGIFMNTDNLQNLSRGLGGQVPNFLSDLNPDDIESVSVLKDANATAVYGARGANGVILITTRRGVKNSRSKINFNAQYGGSKSTNLWQLVTGPEHGQIVNVASTNDGVPANLLPFRPKDQAAAGYPAYGTPEEQPTFDRIGRVFRTAASQKYNLSVTGGDAKTNFYVGGSYEYDESTLRLEDFKRYSLRVNLDHSISPGLKIGTSNSLSYVPRREVRVGDGPAGLFQAALHTPTFYPLYNPDGSYYKVGVFDNVLAILN
ncbi:MAG: TonB-dependent receptor plug domain-containing protein, partial [Chitinophaga rupis]